MMRMRLKRLLSFIIACWSLPCLAVNYYTTLFPFTENPMTEGLLWTNGATTGLDWSDVASTPGKSFGTQIAGGFNDSIACLSGVWGSNQSVKITLNQTASSGFQEMEALLRWHISAHSAWGYECNASISGQYIQIVRWNGASGSFDYVNNSVPFTGTLASGDVIEFRIVGNIITTYQNGVSQHTDDVSSIGGLVHTNGNPGIGFYVSVTASSSNFGITSYQATDDWTNVLFSDGTVNSTQTQLNAATNGQTVVLPTMFSNWTGGVTNKTASKIAGMGASKLVGYSTTSLTVGTGSKTFTTQSGLAITPGQDVTAYYTPSGAPGGHNTQTNMTGTVTSYSGTSLVCNMTSANGSGGTIAWWTIGVGRDRTIITNNSATTTLFSLYEKTATNVDLSGIFFIEGASGGSSANHITINQGYKPARIFDSRFRVANTGARGILSQANNGIVYRCSFDNCFDSGTWNTGNGNNDEGITFKAIPLTTSWSNNSTMGTADSGYTNNFYVEDCYFAALPIECLDQDDNSRSVIRHNIFDNAGSASHGRETSTYGMRHTECYSNVFNFVNAGQATFNIQDWHFIRGGTWVVFGNTFPDITSSQWGSKNSMRVQNQAIQRSPLPVGCITTYPAPRQFGQGWISGSTFIVNGADFNDEESLEPAYIWGNAGGANANAVSLENYTPDGCGNGQLIANYIQVNRDYYLGSAKPGYTMGTYPNPNRHDAIGDPVITAQPQDQSVASGATTTFTVTATGTGTLHYQWTFNGSNIGTDSSSYARSNCQVTDSGKYTQVTVTGDLGSVASAQALLTVTGGSTPASSMSLGNANSQLRVTNGKLILSQ